MQYYHAAPPRPGDGTVYPSYPAPLHPAAAAAAARMQWSPGVHPSQWGYDFYQQAGYPPIATGHPSVSSPDNAAATPHNIRDILGGQQQQQQQQQQGGETLVSEVAKTPSYQKSPTSAAAIGTVFHYPSPHHHYPQSIGPEVRSPTTPTQHSPHDLAAHGFYLPGRHFVGFDPTALSPDGMTLPGATGIIYPGQNPLQDPKAQGEDKSGGNKDNKRDNKKGRATFSGNQIDELEKAFQTTQYLTNSERSRIAERLSLSENQVKIWFQNRRTKCRRTAWKTPGMTSPTTTTAPPTVLSSDSTTTSSATQ